VLREPLAPLVGARRDGVRIDLRRLDDAYTSLERRFDLVVVEGAGGLAVPLDAQTTMADLALRWRLPILIVARPGLGTINHTVLTAAYARAKGIPVLGVVINRYPTEPGVAEETNPKAIAQLTGLPILGILRHRDDVDVEGGRVTGMAEEVRLRMDLGPLRTLEAKA
jgi:dethiobiotin synthetase